MVRQKTKDDYKEELYAANRLIRKHEKKEKLFREKINKYHKEFEFLVKQRDDIVKMAEKAGTDKYVWKRRYLLLEDEFKKLEVKLASIKKIGEKNNGRRNKTKRKPVKNTTSTRRKRRS